MDDENTATSTTPTIEDEILAIRAVLEAMVHLPSKEAQYRVLTHARMYLGLQGKDYY